MAWRSPGKVEVDELARRLAEPRVRVVDCRFSFDADLRAAYREGHIPGAVYCNWAEDLSDPPAPVRWMIASPPRFARVMSRFGIGDDTSVVAYDADGGHQAARLWWALRYYGHDDVAVLHGGLQAWVAAGHRLEGGEVSPPPARFTPRVRPELRATKEDVLAVLGKPAPILLDVRRPSEYEGTEVRAKRGGRIPGARNLEWKEALDASLRLKPADQLRAQFAARGVNVETPVVTYCQGGVRAAHSAWVLSLLGNDRVRVYDGSWEEWGNDPDLPIER
ncbi:MAG TPA: sulfurtransferase [Candidatus Dormibacteraeota bacterium]|jgi:thiosulfate/3-mercaptopyruvate sulfurtransferase|nr:sulfurtransferase [Candidatus Dormibacteraeota bacterium]